jgi:hypothetical protein
MIGFCKYRVIIGWRKDDANDLNSWLAVPDEGFDQFE